ncbi:MAG: MAPEG family protein [Proteobacteria bacterium]|nr:MAPEG family protein [Pseudomonadota bacterium]
MTAVPATLWTSMVTILAILVYFMTSGTVARMRAKHGIKAPAMTGHAEFERAVRVQMNTLEAMPIFLVLLWVATNYSPWMAWLPAAFGVIWTIGRVLYMQGYMVDPEKRGTGFTISMIANLGLLILSVWGIVNAWMALSATT